MATYLVRLRRNECIGAAACVAVDHENWKLVDDGLVVLKESEKKEGEVYEREIGEDELQRFLESAEVCPVEVIEVYNKETGEKLWPQ